MIWTTWRQHRAEAGVAAVLLAGLLTGLVIVGTIARARAKGLRLPACLSSGADCSAALQSLHNDFHSIPPFTAALVVLPLLAGMFWAAPLVSREYEAGTFRLAWTQSVSRVRWVAVKIALIFGVVAVAALAVGLVTTWSLQPLSPAFGGRYNSSWYDIQGIVPVACMLFALSVGVAASAVIRRTIPAMAVTLVAYAAARIPIHWLRAGFVPASSKTLSTPLTTLLGQPGGSVEDAFRQVTPVGSLVQGSSFTGPTGAALPGSRSNFDVLRHYCPNLTLNAAGGGDRQFGNAGACRSTVQNLSLHDKVRFQPLSHFWMMQTVESLIFVGLGAVFVTIAVLAVARRRAT